MPPEEALQELADFGFVLVDTIPFALKYEARMRERPAYLDLVRACKPYFLGKLRDLTWSQDVKTAFAFTWNGRRVIEAYERTISLRQNLLIRLGEEMIAVDASGFTSPTRLRRLFEVSLAPADLAERWRALCDDPESPRHFEINQFGEMILAPKPTPRHQRRTFQVAAALQSQLGPEAATEVGVMTDQGFVSPTPSGCPPSDGGKRTMRRLCRSSPMSASRCSPRPTRVPRSR